jgi:hypothetical protein
MDKQCSLNHLTIVIQYVHKYAHNKKYHMSLTIYLLSPIIRLCTVIIFYMKFSFF